MSTDLSTPPVSTDQFTNPVFDEECVVMDIKFRLPMAYAYMQKLFYVRKCYHRYYQYVMKALNDPLYSFVSITGSPGIGKSVFYLYFFHRYILENPKATVVTAAFRKDGSLDNCRVFSSSSNGIKKDHIPDIEGAIHLYDGPPLVKPSDNFMVCFTSPNCSWFDSMEKASNHIPIFMPVWSLDELLEACVWLDLCISLEVVEERFRFFGGSARYCLALSEPFYLKGYESMIQKIRLINSFEDVKDCLNRRTNMESVVLRIFHFSPVFPLTSFHVPFSCEPFFCSPKVAQLVEQNIQDKSDERRLELVAWIRGTSKSGTFLGWLFEGYVKEKFSNCHEKWLVRSLDNSDFFWTLSFDSTTYIHAETDNYEAIDGYCVDVDANTYFLFQITRNRDHPISFYGITKHFQNQNIDPESAKLMDIRLIFVVPKSLADFKQQKIFSERSLLDVSYSVTSIKGIGAAGARKLQQKNISSIQELQDAVETDPSLGAYKKLLDRHNNMFSSMKKWEWLENISQYVIILDVDF